MIELLPPFYEEDWIDPIIHQNQEYEAGILERNRIINNYYN